MAEFFWMTRLARHARLVKNRNKIGNMNVNMNTTKKRIRAEPTDAEWLQEIHKLAQRTHAGCPKRYSVHIKRGQKSIFRTITSD